MLVCQVWAWEPQTQSAMMFPEQALGESLSLGLACTAVMLRKGDVPLTSIQELKGI